MDIEILIYVERSHKCYFNVAILYSKNDLYFDGIEYVSQEVALRASCLFKNLHSLSHFDFLSKSYFFGLNNQEYLKYNDISKNSNIALNGAWNLSEDELYSLVDFIVKEAKEQELSTNINIEYNGDFRCVYKSSLTNQLPFYMHLFSMRILKIS